MLQHLRVVLCLQVVVSEAAPGYEGHDMASRLAQAKVQTTLIADSAVFAMMARVNKVCVCPVVSVMARVCAPLFL
jgi:translation initiation factor 2B subunit (eIF-2B alpha/beta/delta family)